MRPEHLLNMGYTPTAVEALREIAALLQAPEQGPVRLYDPTCGGGHALAFLADALHEQGAQVETYGVEIVEGRARQAREILDHVLHADVLSNVIVGPGAFSLALINPPYDRGRFDDRDTVEQAIIRHALARLTRRGGVAVLVVPQRLLPWLRRFRFEWLALFPTHDPGSPGQVVLIGRRSETPSDLPPMGARHPVPVPAAPPGRPTFRVRHLFSRDIEEALERVAPLPDRLLYGHPQPPRLRALHPLGPGHRALLLLAYGHSVRLPDGTLLRVTARVTEDVRIEETEGPRRKRVMIIERRPEVRVFRLRPGGRLEDLPLAAIGEHVDDIEATLNLHLLVRDRGDGWPETEPWEEEVIRRVGSRLPPLQGRRGFLPGQALRAVGMARALLAGEKGVYGIMEMGFGKTPMALLIRALLLRGLRELGSRQRVGLTVVMCPPHLVKKWEREARRLAPEARVLVPSGGGERRMAEVQRALYLARKGFPVILVLSREALKLGPLHRVGLVPRWVSPELARADGAMPGDRIWACPHCGVPAVEKKRVEDEDDLEIVTYFPLSTHPEPPRRFLDKKCSECGLPYAAPAIGPGSPRRWPLAEIIARAVSRGQVPGGLLLIVDEVHEYRNDTLQGMAFGRLFRVARWAVLLTGTLFGGKASHLFNLLRWTSPEFRRLGLGRTAFVKTFGHSRAVITLDERRTYGRSLRQKARFVEQPGVSPLVYQFLFGRTAFGALEDVAPFLPPLTEHEERVPALHPFRRSQGGAIFHDQGPMAFMAWLRAALGYNNAAPCDPPEEDQHVYGFWRRDPDGVPMEYEVVLRLPRWDPGGVYPKEQVLIEVCRAQKARGRKVVLLLEQTRKRDLAGRLADLLTRHGLRVAVLRPEQVSTGRREEWILKTAPRIDVLITHPAAVETGLDLVMFQTVVIYEAVHNIIRLNQALRRVHRIGQTRPVAFYVLQYQGTLEPDAWKVIRLGIAWSRTLYGNFIPDLGDPNLDLLAALRQEFERGRGVGDVPRVTLSGFAPQAVSAATTSPDGSRGDLPSPIEASPTREPDDWDPRHARQLSLFEILA